MEDEFGDINLLGLGLDLQDLITPEAAEALAVKEEEVEYPIVPIYSEKYDSVVILVHNEIDMNHIRELLRLEKRKSYKSAEVGLCHVIEFSQFIEAWKSK